MMLLPFWSIFIIFSLTEATSWNVTVCFEEEYTSASFTLDYINYVNVTSEKAQRCFNAGFELDNATKPSFLKVLDELILEKAIVEAHHLREAYIGSCSISCWDLSWIKLVKATNWTVELIRGEVNDDDSYSFLIEQYEEINAKFERYSRTSNKSFFLPMAMNNKSHIIYVTSGKLWLNTKMTLKNMETSQIYSCIYLQSIFHECIMINESTWKIELTSRSKLIEGIDDIDLFVGVSSSELNSSLAVEQKRLTFQMLGYLPTIFALTSISNMSIGEVEMEFKSTEETLKISKIVMTKMLTGEEYGCVDIRRTNARKYSCKLRKSRKWLLKIISPEEYVRVFSVEIIQDTLSSFARHLRWAYFGIFGDSYIKYFKLTTYEDKEITNLNLHFDDKSLKISEISLISNYSEYKFKRNEENNTQNASVIGFSRITEDLTYSESKKTEVICQYIQSLLNAKKCSSLQNPN